MAIKVGILERVKILVHQVTVTLLGMEIAAMVIRQETKEEIQAKKDQKAMKVRKTMKAMKVPFANHLTASPAGRAGGSNVPCLAAPRARREEEEGASKRQRCSETRRDETRRAVGRTK